MRSTTFIGAAVAALALGLSACGADGEEPANAGTTEEQERRQAMVKFAQCMREQGIDMPDPTAEGGLVVEHRGAPEKMEAAHKACEKFQPPPPELSEKEQAEMKERALEHARCMREQGIDFPDPTFSAEGAAQIRIEKSRGIDPNDPDFKAAQEACGDGAIMGKTRVEE